MNGAEHFQDEYWLMDREADTRREGLQRLRSGILRLLGWAGKLALLVIGLWGLMIGFLFVSRPFDCVEMPNGFLIGRATVFSSMYETEDGLPDIAIRYPDGRLFARGDNKMHFWDVDGFGGRFDRPRRGDGEYIYLNEVGLITKKDQPELYRSALEKKMREHEDSRQTSGGHVMRTYLLLRESQGIRKSFCPTDWFLPEETE